MKLPASVVLLGVLTVGSAAAQFNDPKGVESRDGPLAYLGTVSLTDALGEYNRVETIDQLRFSADGGSVTALFSSYSSEQAKWHLLTIDTEGLKLVQRSDLSLRPQPRETDSRREPLIRILDDRYYFAQSSQETLIFDFESAEPVNRYEWTNGGWLFNQELIVGHEALDWRTGQIYENWYGNGGFVELTDAGWVLSTNIPNGLVLSNPKQGKHTNWNSRIRGPVPFMSQSGRFVVAADNGGKCRVWRIPELEQVGRCGRRFFGGSAAVTAHAVHPNEERIAIAWGQKLHVYDLDPWRKVTEIDLPETPLSMEFDTNSRLVVLAGPGGPDPSYLQVWSLLTGELLAQAQFEGFLARPPGLSKPSFTFLNPNGKQVMISRHLDQKAELVFYRLSE